MIKLSFRDSPMVAKLSNFVKAKKQFILLGILEITLLITVFLLGIITGKNQFRNEPIVLEGVTPVPEASILVPAVSKQNVNPNGNYVASSRGKMYYPIDCPAGSNLKEENKIYFKTSTAAEEAGYKRSSSCP